MTPELEAAALRAIAEEERRQAEPAMDNWREPTDKQVVSACYSYRHDFGLMQDEERHRLMFEARRWLHAWRHEFVPIRKAEGK